MADHGPAETGSNVLMSNGCAHALQKCFVPGGYREALAVIDAAYVERGENSRPSGWAPFTAFIAQPVPRKS